MARWKVKLGLESVDDYRRLTALLAASEVGSARLTSHVLDTVEGTCAAAGWCVRMRRTERLDGPTAQLDSYTVSVRPYDRTHQDAVEQLFPWTEEAVGADLGMRIANGAFIHVPSGRLHSKLLDAVLNVPGHKLQRTAIVSAGSILTTRTMYAWNGLVLELDKFRTRDSEGWHLQFPTDGLAESMTLQLMKMLQTQRVRFTPSPPSKTMRLLAELNQPTSQVPSVCCQDDGSGTVTCPFNLHPSRAATSSSSTSAGGPAAGHELGGAGSSAGMDAAFAGQHAGTDMEDLAMYFNDRACLPSSDPMSAWLAQPDTGALTDPWVAGMDDSGASPRQGVLDPYYQTSELFAGAKLDDFDANAAASAAALPPLVPSSASGTTAERRRPGKARSTTPQVKDSPPATPAMAATGAAGSSSSSAGAAGSAAGPTKSRSCEASARYRRRKQSELEILRKQYLDMFAENKRLAERIDELEEANRRLTTRLLLYEPPLG